MNAFDPSPEPVEGSGLRIQEVQSFFLRCDDCGWPLFAPVCPHTDIVEVALVMGWHMERRHGRRPAELLGVAFHISAGLRRN